jgi:hypothetical protein
MLVIQGIERVWSLNKPFALKGIDTENFDTDSIRSKVSLNKLFALKKVSILNWWTIANNTLCLNKPFALKGIDTQCVS